MSTSVQIYNFQFLGSLDSAYILRVALAFGDNLRLTVETTLISPVN